jgi:hypothetical protein
MVRRTTRADIERELCELLIHSPEFENRRTRNPGPQAISRSVRPKEAWISFAISLSLCVEWLS